MIQAIERMVVERESCVDEVLEGAVAVWCRLQKWERRGQRHRV
jgi:hypothetical protein